MAKEKKNVNIEISLDCWKKLKIIAVQREIYLQQVAMEILEKYCDKKTYDELLG